MRRPGWSSKARRPGWSSEVRKPGWIGEERRQCSGDSSEARGQSGTGGGLSGKKRGPGPSNVEGSARPRTVGTLGTRGCGDFGDKVLCGDFGDKTLCGDFRGAGEQCGVWGCFVVVFCWGGLMLF